MTNEPQKRQKGIRETDALLIREARTNMRLLEKAVSLTYACVAGAHLRRTAIVVGIRVPTTRNNIKNLCPYFGHNMHQNWCLLK